MKNSLKTTADFISQDLHPLEEALMKRNEERLLDLDYALRSVECGDSDTDKDIHTPNSNEGASDFAESSTSGSCTGGTNNGSRYKSNFDYHFRRDWVEKMSPEEVRWFYKDPTEKQWTAFIGYDSLRIEIKYQDLTINGCPQCLAREEMKKKRHQENDESDGRASVSSLISLEEDEILENESCAEKVIVRGSLFEVNVLARKMSPIYWSGVLQTARIIRGTWFKNDTWEPLDEELANKIEEEHLRQFEGVFMSELSSQQQPVSALDRKKPSAIHVLKIGEFHVDWYDLDEIYLYSESTSLFIRQKLGLQKVGTRLRRGYHSVASMDEKPADITHLCFVIHGIGQKILTGAIIKSCADLREACDRIKQQFFPDLNLSNQRVEFLPVEWRSSLRLDGDTVDSITPTHLRSLRTLLNSSAMDILYYTSPLYRSEIILGLKAELNRLYSMFCARHPYFEANGGKVSVVAHSLGTVITYDIIMGGMLSQDKIYEQYFETIKARNVDVNEFARCVHEMETTRKRLTELEQEMMNIAGKEITASSVNAFRLENLFCLGSPLAVFLALRGIRPKDTGSLHHILPEHICRRLFNIYHPADPVAYRLEPLILKHYATIHPVIIYRWDAKAKMNYDAVLPEIISVNDKGKKTFAVPRNVNVNDVKNRTNKEYDEEDFSRIQKTLHGSAQLVQQQGDELSDETLNENEPQVIETTFGSRFMGMFQRMRSADGQRKLSRPESPALADVKKKRVVASPTIDSELRDLRRIGITTIGGSNHQGVSSVQRSNLSSPDLIQLSPRLSNRIRSGTTPTTITTTSPLSSTISTDVYVAATESTYLEHRVDFQLRERRYESSYLAVLTSHTAYWTNPDVAMFIMTQLFPQYGPIGIPKPAKL